jgi:hypothetical protein
MDAHMARQEITTCECNVARGTDKTAVVDGVIAKVAG